MSNLINNEQGFQLFCLDVFIVWIVEGVGGVLGSVECQAAGGNGFSSRCPLPQLRATVR